MDAAQARFERENSIRNWDDWRKNHLLTCRSSAGLRICTIVSERIDPLTSKTHAELDHFACTRQECAWVEEP